MSSATFLLTCSFLQQERALVHRTFGFGISAQEILIQHSYSYSHVHRIKNVQKKCTILFFLSRFYSLTPSLSLFVCLSDMLHSYAVDLVNQTNGAHLVAKWNFIYFRFYCGIFYKRKNQSMTHKRNTHTYTHMHASTHAWNGTRSSIYFQNARLKINILFVAINSFLLL